MAWNRAAVIGPTRRKSRDRPTHNPGSTNRGCERCSLAVPRRRPRVWVAVVFLPCDFGNGGPDAHLFSGAGRDPATTSAEHRSRRGGTEGSPARGTVVSVSGARALLAAVAFALGVLAACFSDSALPCPKGEKGCRCLDDTCESGLECSEGYCVIEDCTRGEAYCNCDDGTCVGIVECFDGAVCLPPEDDDAGGSGDATGGEGPDPTTAALTTEPVPGDTTDAPGACTPGEACGACRVCDDAGTCVVDVGAPCDGPTIQCADFLWGYMDGTCYRLAAMELGARCDAFGECSSPGVQACAADQGEPQVVCDPSCVDAAASCVPNAAAETVSVDSMCVTGGFGPDCAPSCFNGSYSQFSYRACDDGACTPVTAKDIDCGAYSCESGACNTSCQDQLDCAMFYACDMGTQTCYLP